MDNPIKFMPCQIRLQSPVLITGTVGDENIALSENYISGTSLLGTLANYYINISNPRVTEAHKNDKFRKLFLDGDIQFTNGYKLNDDSIRSLPIPLSIQFPKGSDKPHELLFREFDEKSEKDTKYRDGFCVLKNTVSSIDFEKVPVNKHINFHHQRTNQLLGKSDSGEIFNYESLNPFQTFEAFVVGPEEILKELVKALKSDRISCRLGRSKNSQYGRAEIELKESEMKDFEIAEFSFEREDDAPEFTVTLLSNTILLDELGQARVCEKIFKNYLINQFNNFKITINQNEISIQNSFVRTEHIENYVSVWKARKPAVTAFRMGSCFRVRIDGEIWKSNLNAINVCLLQLQQQGIGVRRNEGFGRIAINWQSSEEINNITEKKWKSKIKSLKDTQPQGDVPDIVKTIFKKTLRTYLKDKVKNAAAIKLGDFSLLSSGSTISRLQHFLLKSENEDDFLKKINKLSGKPAMDKLTGIVVQGESKNLYGFLTKKDSEPDVTEIKHTIIKKFKKLDEKLVQVSGFLLEDELMEEMYREYLGTLFVLMQKKLKKEGNHE